MVKGGEGGVASTMAKTTSPFKKSIEYAGDIIPPLKKGGQGGFAL
jgi:hypothetical protein